MKADRRENCLQRKPPKVSPEVITEQTYLEMAVQVETVANAHPALLANRAHIQTQLRLASHDPCHPQNRALLIGVRLLMRHLA